MIKRKKYSRTQVESTWSGESSFGGDETRGLEGRAQAALAFFFSFFLPQLNNCREIEKMEIRRRRDPERKKNIEERKSHS